MIRELLDVLRQTRHENGQFQHQLDLLHGRRYGPRTERFDPNQPLLFADALDTPVEPATQDAPPAADPKPDATPDTNKKQPVQTDPPGD